MKENKKKNWIEIMKEKGYDGSDIHWMAVKHDVAGLYNVFGDPDKASKNTMNCLAEVKKLPVKDSEKSLRAIEFESREQGLIDAEEAAFKKFHEFHFENPKRYDGWVHQIKEFHKEKGSLSDVVEALKKFDEEKVSRGSIVVLDVADLPKNFNFETASYFMRKQPLAICNSADIKYKTIETGEVKYLTGEEYFKAFSCYHEPQRD